MKRYFNVTKIEWGEYLHKTSWYDIRREKLPTEINFLSLENIQFNIYEAICNELALTYGYSVNSIEFIEMNEEESMKQALYILLPGIC